MSLNKRPLFPILTVLLFLGFIDAWAGRRSYVAGDSVSYMDMARRIADGDIYYAINGHWSPLYSVILAVFIRPFQTNSAIEFSVVRGVNFLIFALTMGLFHFFLTRFFDQYYGRLGPTADSSPPMSRLQFTVVAYALFAWSCFGLTTVSRVNPDICAAATTFVAATMLLSFKDGRLSHIRFVLFGAVLGIGYLFKAIFFPLSLLFLAAAALEPQVRAVRGRLLLSLVTFLVIASPLILGLSMKYGHLTYGESGKNTYRTDVLKSALVHWQGDPSGSGVPEHPTRKIFENPDAYEFSSPIVATYAPWYDPTYWNAGAAVRFDIWTEAWTIARNLKRLVGIVWMGIPIALMFLVAHRYFRVSPASILYFKSLWLVGVGNLGTYALVLIESRYLAGCLPILVILSLSAVRIRTMNSTRTVGAALLLLFVLGVTFQTGPRLAQATAVLVHTSGDVRDDAWLVADEFQRLGVRSGTPVAAIDQQDDRHWSPAVIGDWAFLAHMRVVSEVSQPGYDGRAQFWQTPPDRQIEALRALQRAGAQIVVASGVPAGANTTGWTQIRSSKYYYRFLE